LGLNEPSPAASDKADRHSIADPRIIVGDGVEAEAARSFIPQPQDPLHRIFREQALGRLGCFAAQCDKPDGLAEFKHRRGRPEVLPRISAKNVVAEDRKGGRLSKAWIIAIVRSSRAGIVDAKNNKWGSRA
jgi:hypothetical protein